MTTEMTVAKALRLKKQLVEKLNRTSVNALNEVSYLRSEQVVSIGSYKRHEDARGAIKLDLLRLKNDIAFTNFQAGVIPLILKLGEWKEELTHLNYVRKIRNGGDRYSYTRSIPSGVRIVEAQEGDSLLHSITKDELNGHIDNLTEDVAELDSKLQALNHTTPMQHCPESWIG